MITFIEEGDDLPLGDGDDLNRLDAPFSLEVNDIIDAEIRKK